MPSLPYHVWELVFFCLSFSEINSISFVCKFLHQLGSSENVNFWRDKLIKDDVMLERYVVVWGVGV
jgi:hypothetical protein